MRFISVLFAALLAGCTVTTAPTGPSQPQSTAPATRAGYARSAAQGASMLSAVVDRVEPVAEQECRQRTRNVNCNLSIFLEDDPRAAPNAFQTLDRNGNPVIVFTIALARDVNNADELAFILGHEAAHHIRGHIPQTQQTAVLGAILAGALAQAGGGGADTVQIAQDLGGMVGSRTFSKGFELEADQLGTVIAAKAGYDPLRGVEYFARVPDPGDRFLGSHPPNADRIRIVRQTAAGL